MVTYKNNPTPYVKDVTDTYSPILIQSSSSEIINKKFFPTILKLSDVTPVFKKIDSI